MSKKNSNIKERVLLIAENEENSKQLFFKKVGLNYSNFTGKSKESNLNSASIAEILLNYPNINPIWLLAGKGEMVQDSYKVRQKVLKESENYTGKNLAASTMIDELKSTIKEKEQAIKEKDSIIKQLLEQQQKLINKLLIYE